MARSLVIDEKIVQTKIVSQTDVIPPLPCDFHQPLPDCLRGFRAI